MGARAVRGGETHARAAGGRNRVGAAPWRAALAPRCERPFRRSVLVAAAYAAPRERALVEAPLVGVLIMDDHPSSGTSRAGYSSRRASRSLARPRRARPRSRR